MAFRYARDADKFYEALKKKLNKFGLGLIYGKDENNKVKIALIRVLFYISYILYKRAVKKSFNVPLFKIFDRIAVKGKTSRLLCNCIVKQYIIKSSNL